MPYELNADRNVLTLHDKLSGGELEFYHRLPTNSERMAYDNALTVRKGNKIIVPKNRMLIRAQYGVLLLRGIRKGDFAVDGKVISSDQDDPAYYPDWRKMLLQKRPDLLAVLAMIIMDPVSEPAAPELEFEFEEGDPMLEDLDAPIKPGEVDNGDVAAPAAATDTSTTPAPAGEASAAAPLSAQ